MKEQVRTAHYNAINGLRAFACIGILMLHVQANTHFGISGYLYGTVIDSFTNFVFLFMEISAFGMCCGYLERVLNGTVDFVSFYRKRYSRILPFFALLVLLDVTLSGFAYPSLMEGLADVTLMFGLFPNNISVIGVGWYLGLVFAFYLIFPFYCTLLKTRLTAWCTFVVSVLFSVEVAPYFALNRSNIVYSFCFFLAGGLIYLYREPLARFNQKHRWLSLLLCILAILLYYVAVPFSILLASLLTTTILLAFAVGGYHPILDNPVTAFISDLSMEIYLSHMVIFRGVELVGITRLLPDKWFSYLLLVAIVFAGAVCFSFTVKTMSRIINTKLFKKAIGSHSPS